MFIPFSLISIWLVLVSWLWMEFSETKLVDCFAVVCHSICYEILCNHRFLILTHLCTRGHACTDNIRACKRCVYIVIHRLLWLWEKIERVIFKSTSNLKSPKNIVAKCNSQTHRMVILKQNWGKIPNCTESQVLLDKLRVRHRVFWNMYCNLVQLAIHWNRMLTSPDDDAVPPLIHG